MDTEGDHGSRRGQTGRSVRVVIADDHAVVRAGLTELVSAFGGVEVVGTARDGAEAVAITLDSDADVVLMDLEMPGMDGISATARILAERPGVSVVIFTSFSDRDRIFEALDTGAIGYLLKDAEPDEIHRGIVAAARRESPLAPKAARELVGARGKRSAAQLSDREREVLSLVAAGLANKQIGRRLGITEKTVKTHLTSIFHRIGVADRTQAALWAERHGLVRPPTS